ncbi:hypothetical protein KIH86_03735 [Paenibacillus sp. HN-1]|uniref:hypothetical protein n=1 Tax=Paenibacillus TaxID=44249 RepID=UPI001CA92C5B|nr:MULTISPECIES: hypothetical protein [Paenibacillus]MBY9077294.1 hypothetical protein [Paenibacillus sp. CGMCC 1.18879]MBY9083341.1 hypothetical protein [Paenibacillus sinensis]
MKKYFFYGLTLSLAIISGCSSDNSAQPTSEKPVAAQTQAPTTVDPKIKLIEVQNYVVGDLWNTGFVDAISYINTGTSSIGQSLDIDLTMDQLGKAITKKVEYDQYINSLPTEYDNVKSVWTKLSAEADQMYKQLQATPPKANAGGAPDSGKFNQYLTAFSNAVSEISK